MAPAVWRGFSPATRVAAGLVALTLSLILISNLFIGFLPDRSGEAERAHAAAAATVVASISEALRRVDQGGLQASLSAAVAREPLLRSAAIVADRAGQAAASAAEGPVVARGSAATATTVRGCGADQADCGGANDCSAGPADCGTASNCSADPARCATAGSCSTEPARCGTAGSCSADPPTCGTAGAETAGGGPVADTAAGLVLASTGGHAEGWSLPPGAHATALNLRAPIVADGRPWGELQLVFHPAAPNRLIAWLRDPMVTGLALVALLGFVSFQLYLRRVLRYLDPNAAVPERVRTAFDTLVEGVLVLDADGQVLLANKAFLQWHPQAGPQLTGRPVESLAWLMQGLPASPPGTLPPWRRALADNRASLGHALQLALPGQPPRELVLNCSPISDGSPRARGCLMSFSDVTELEDRTRRLQLTLGQLSASKAEIERKNLELTRLATRDALTGCLNRRSFMEETDQRFAEARHLGRPACVIMCDIDHFKRVNDSFGHAAGDRVIQAAVKSLTRGLRVGDLLGRYGGEEFCILLPGATLAQALQIAERLRADVEAHVGDAVREPAGVTLTMSFGAAELSPQTADPAALIDQADQALYASKKNGRNRVTAYSTTAPVEP